ncbi:MAG TPA: alpha/beta family hydrolase [Burkholderiales bacterium]|nr:alpha/beta family hydrolase [Burkholderiales bacterium]
MAQSAAVAWVHDAAPEARALLVCAHGAGGHRDDRHMLSLSNVLVGTGIDMVRFNFDYRERGSRRIDPMPKLKACMRAVVEEVRARLAPKRLLVGGRSMGARVATMLAAEGLACEGLALFAYPLHPAGEPEKLRAAHLADLRVPVLCLNGTRDALCRQDLMEKALETVRAPWTMHWLEGADHSFHVLKSSGRTDAEVLREVADALSRWQAAALP